VIDLSAVDSVIGLVTASDNSLVTSGPVAITFAYDEDSQIKLAPSSKKNQFVVTEANIIILPMILSPVTSSVATTDTQTMEGLGGYGDYVYSFVSNASGGTINAVSGLYTAGSTPGTDILKVTDAMGHTATATVTVA
jgi:hypothetical protein